MSTFLKANNTETPCEAAEHYRDSAWGRPTCTVTIKGSAAEIAALLPNNAPWSLIEREDALDESGAPTGQTVDHERDMSEYSLSGDITDHRDGTVSIKMGKPTETESTVGAMVALTGEVVTAARAAELRPMIEAAAMSLSDGEAATAVELFPKWAYPVSYIVGNRVSDSGKLYKCRKAHTSQERWNPAATPDLWVVIDVAHAGTQDDPIPAARGMEYEYGKYYLDSEDGKLYLCERTGEAAGGKIVLQYLPHELVGNYFKAVSA
nr:MAG TPA: ChiA1-BD-binding domain protein [Caudoviricetes sp.]